MCVFVDLASDLIIDSTFAAHRLSTLFIFLKKIQFNRLAGVFVSGSTLGTRSSTEHVDPEQL